MLSIAASFQAALSTGMVDQNMPHHLRGNAEEVCPILPVNVALIDESKISLVDEGRCLQGMVGAFAPHVMMGKPAQLFMHQRQKFIERGLVAAAPIQKELGNSMCRGRSHPDSPFGAPPETARCGADCNTFQREAILMTSS